MNNCCEDIKLLVLLSKESSVLNGKMTHVASKFDKTASFFCVIFCENVNPKKIKTEYYVKKIIYNVR